MFVYLVDGGVVDLVGLTKRWNSIRVGRPLRSLKVAVICVQEDSRCVCVCMLLL